MAIWAVYPVLIILTHGTNSTDSIVKRPPSFPPVVGEDVVSQIVARVFTPKWPLMGSAPSMGLKAKWHLNKILVKPTDIWILRLLHLPTSQVQKFNHRANPVTVASMDMIWSYIDIHIYIYIYVIHILWTISGYCYEWRLMGIPPKSG